MVQNELFPFYTNFKMKILKRFLIIQFVFLLFLQPISKMYIIVSFYIQRDYIAENLCEMKEVEGNCCRGKCQLKRDLSLTAAPIEYPVLPKSTIEILFNTYTAFFVLKAPYEIKNSLCPAFYQKIFIPKVYLTGVFQPPQSLLF